MVAKEFDECLREIIKYGYGLNLISHEQDKTFKREDGTEYNQITPTLPTKAKLVVARLTDIIAYVKPEQDAEGNTVTMLYLRSTPTIMAGSRFAYMPAKIPFGYQNLVDAIADAIDEIAKHDGEQAVTASQDMKFDANTNLLNYDELIVEFNDLIKSIPGSSSDKAGTEEGKHFKSYWVPVITEITEKYLGKGAKVNTATRDQVEAISLIVEDLKDKVVTALAKS